MRLLYPRLTAFTALLLLLTSGLWAQSGPNPNNGTPSTLTGTALRNWLKQNWYDTQHNTLGYNSARTAMYSYIDARADGRVYCVYSGFNQPAASTTYLNPINAEHSIPQSFFGQDEPMRSDIHHLYPTHERVNSTRNNFPFAELVDANTDQWIIWGGSGTSLTTTTSIPATNRDLYSEYETTGDNFFEVPEAHKGDLARAIFYFYTMYPTQAGPISGVGDINTFYDWHLQDPPDAREIQRNQRVIERQGNSNPYIEFPDIVARAWGFAAAPPCAGPTVAGADIVASNTTSTSTTLTWTNGNGTNRLVLMRPTGGFAAADLPVNGTVYSANSVYGSAGSALGAAYVVYSGTGSSVTVTGLAPSTGYSITVIEFSCSPTLYLTALRPVGSVTTSAPVACVAPPNSGGMNLNPNSSTSVSLVSVSGPSPNVLVLARPDAQGSTLPAVTDGTTYTASTVFGSGSQVSGASVVYFGPAGTLNRVITGLQPSTAYRFFSYNADCDPVKYTSVIANAVITTPAQPSGPITNAETLFFSEYIESSVGANKVLEIYNGTGAAVNLDRYEIRVYNNGASTSPNRTIELPNVNLANNDVYVVAQPSNALATSQVDLTATLDYNGDDAVILVDSATSAFIDIIGVLGCDPGSNWSAGGNLITQDRVLQRKPEVLRGVTVNPTGTCSATSFTTLATEWNGFPDNTATGLGTHTFTPTTPGCPVPSAATQTLTLDQPTPTSLRVNYTKGTGNGERRTILIKEGTSFTAADLPVNGQQYIASTDIENGSVVGTAVVVLSEGAASGNAVITGLTPGTQYVVASFESSCNPPVYLTGGTLTTATASTTTEVCAQPTSGSTNISLSLQSANALEFTWTAGNGANRLLIMRQGSAVADLPTDANTYTASSVFGTPGTALGSGFVVYNGSGDSVRITGLTASTTYHLAVVEYNCAPEDYLTTTGQVLVAQTTTPAGGGATTTDLIFTEYIEAPVGNNKFVEIYNGASTTKDMTLYEVAVFANGNSTPANVIALTGSLAPGGVFVLANSSYDPTFWAGTPNQTSSGLTHNGNDAVVLRVAATDAPVDIIGNIGCDPGTEWTSGSLTTKDATLRRNGDVTTGVSTDPGNSPCEFPTLASQWTLAAGVPSDNLGTVSTTVTDVRQPRELNSRVVAYPNPAHQVLYLRAQDLTLANQTATYEVVDLLGRRVAQGQVPLGSQAPSIDMTGLVPGVYVLRLQAGTERGSYRIVKQ